VKPLGGPPPRSRSDIEWKPAGVAAMTGGAMSGIELKPPAPPASIPALPASTSPAASSSSSPLLQATQSDATQSAANQRSARGGGRTELVGGPLSSLFTGETSFLGAGMAARAAGRPFRSSAASWRL